MLNIHAKPEWFPEQSWKGEDVFILAAGPSASLYDYKPFRGKAKFVVVNNSYKLVPWADVLVSSDGDWWHRNNGAIGFQGTKLTCDWQITQHYPNVHMLRLSKIHPDITIDRPGYIGIGLNSGFYAINVAIQFSLCHVFKDRGPMKRLILCGFDMNMINGVHWDGIHRNGDGTRANNPDKDKLKRWCKILDKQSKVLRDFGVEVINTCMTSSLNNYPKMTLDQIFGSNHFDQALMKEKT